MADLTDHWRKLYANNYLGAWDLFIGGRYREVSVTIEDVQRKEVVREGGVKEDKWLLTLRGKKARLPAPMIVSNPNGKTLEAMFGESPSGWVGKAITLFAKEKRTREGKAMVLTIRNSRGNAQMREELEGRHAPAAPRIDPDEFTDVPDDPDKGP